MGVYQGDGSTCDSVVCPFGACCCQQSGEVQCETIGPVTEQQCEDDLGCLYQGDGSTCDSVVCPFGACCCQQSGAEVQCETTGPVTEQQCEDFGCLYQGDGSRCDEGDQDFVCPFGACCCPDGTCLTIPSGDPVTQQQCEGDPEFPTGCIYQDDSTRCFGSGGLFECPQPPTATPTSTATITPTAIIDRYTDQHAHSNPDRHINRYTDRHAHSNPDRYTHANSNGHSDCHANRYRNGNPNQHPITKRRAVYQSDGLSIRPLCRRRVLQRPVHGAQRDLQSPGERRHVHRDCRTSADHVAHRPADRAWHPRRDRRPCALASARAEAVSMVALKGNFTFQIPGFQPSASGGRLCKLRKRQ